MTDWFFVQDDVWEFQKICVQDYSCFISSHYFEDMLVRTTAWVYTTNKVFRLLQQEITAET